MKTAPPLALLWVAATLAYAAPQVDKELAALAALPVPELRTSAEKGNAQAQSLLGRRYALGEGIASIEGNLGPEGRV